MAATTNLMSVDAQTIRSSVKARNTSTSMLQRQQVSQKYTNGIINDTKNFDKVFDKVSNNPAPSKDIYKASSEVIKDTEDPISAAITTSAQGKSSKNTQDAPQKESNATNESTKIDDIDDDELKAASSPTQPMFIADILSFAETNGEILGDTLVDDEQKTNLMTILPQSQEDGNKSQSMLNLLSGRTWQVNQSATSDVIDVKSSAINLNVVLPTEGTVQQQTLVQPQLITSASMPTVQNVADQSTVLTTSVENSNLLNLDNLKFAADVSQLQSAEANISDEQVNVLTQLAAANVNDLQEATDQMTANLESTQINLQQAQQNLAGQQNAQPTVDVSNQQSMLTNTNDAQQLINSQLVKVTIDESSISNNVQPQVQSEINVQQNQQSQSIINENSTSMPLQTPLNQQVNSVVTAQTEEQTEQFQQSTQITAQNESAQPINYTAVRQMLQQSEYAVQLENGSANATNNESTQIQMQSQLVNQNQQSTLLKLSQQEADIIEMPQAQAVVAEVSDRQQSNQLNLNNLVNAEAELNEDVQPLTPNQSAQQNQNQQQNLQSNLQSATANEVSSEESNQTKIPAESFTAHLGVATNNLNNSQPILQQAEQTQQAATTAQDEFNITGQIVEHAKMIRTAQNTEMVIHLKPEHLGELTLRVSVTSNGSVNASFHSDNAAVRTMIENTIVHLKQELANQGLKVDSVQVYSGLDGNLMNGRGQQAWQQNQQGNNAQQGKRVNGVGKASGDGRGSATEMAAASTSINNVVSADGVDYRV